MRSFDPKRPAEAVTLTFEFAPDLPPGVTILSAEPSTATLLRGVDADPAAILSGAAALVGTDVLQMAEGGVEGADYLVVARVLLSDGQSRELPAILPVRRVF